MACLNSCAGATERLPDSLQAIPAWSLQAAPEASQRGSLGYLLLPTKSVVAVPLGASFAGRRVCSCGTHGVPESLRCGDAGAPRCCGAAISPFDGGFRAGPPGAGIGGVTAPATDSGAREPKSKIFKILQNEIFVGQGLPDSWDPGVFILLWYGPPCWVLGWSPKLKPR